MIEVYTQSFDGIWFGVACIQQQIVASSFGVDPQKVLNNILGNLPYNSPFQVFNEPSAQAKDHLAQIKSIYDGHGIDASFSLALNRLPPYTQKVLKATSQIPLGYVTSYGAISKAVGGGPRAVGNVMAANPFAPIVPCHRVVKSDFTLGGYGMGLKVKVEFLGREKRGFANPKEVDVGGRALEVFPIEYALRNLA